MGHAFQYKWGRNGYAHFYNETEAQLALHWARLVAKHNSNSITF